MRVATNWTDELDEQLVPTHLGDINIRVGGREDGPLLVCWPSLFMDGTMWQYQYEHFAARYRMVLIDSPGHGKSDGLRHTIDLKDSSDVVVAILDAVGAEKCILMGNRGGMLAGSFPAHYPERTLATIAINASATPANMLESVWVTAFSGWLQLNATMPSSVARIARYLFGGPTAKASRPEFLDWTSVVLHDDPKSVSWALRSFILGRQDEHRRLSTISPDIPVLVIAGEEDSQFPVHIVRRMADAIPSSTFEVLAHSAHLAARETPGEVNQAVDRFLSNHNLP
jgi:3-oxoadipate enol-lactonase